MSVYLNPVLVEEQKLTTGDTAKIQLLHGELHIMFEEMKALESDDPSLREYAEKLQDLEFRMQDAWKWERNADKHTWWFQSPHCKCPYMENMDAFGTEFRHVLKSCPLHGVE